MMTWHDTMTFLTALVLFNQWDYFNHSSNDSDWPIVACFIRVWSVLYNTTEQGIVSLFVDQTPAVFGWIET